jgi:hypothetical protein
MKRTNPPDTLADEVVLQPGERRAEAAVSGNEQDGGSV